MISEAEKNYECKNWKMLDKHFVGAQFLSPIERYRFCNTDSQNFRDLVAMGKGHQATLLDYELINLGYSPTNGSYIQKAPDGRLLLTIFGDEGNVTYIQEI